MGSSNNDKWLGKLKDSVVNYSEPLPDNFWEELRKDIPVTAPVVVKRKKQESLIWTMAVAAVVLLALVLFIPQKEETAAVQTAVVEQKKVELPESMPVSCVAMKKEGYGRLQLSGNPGDAPHVITEQKNNVAVLQEPEKSIAEAEMEFKEKRDIGTDGKSESGVNGESYRTEYLKELGYLREECTGRGLKIRRMATVTVGYSGIVAQSADNVFAGGDVHNSSVGGAQASQGMGNLWGETLPETVASFINMAIQPVENVAWLGGNSPSPFNSPMACRSYNYNHREPVRVGLSFAAGLVGGLYAESGISYQYLVSEMLLGGSEKASQRLHYIGVPVRLGMNFMPGCRFQVYLSGGYMIEKCVYGVLEFPNGVDMGLDLPGVINSVNVAAGFQFMAGDHIALYLEPAMYSYIGLGDDIGRDHGYIIKNRYSNNPTGFSVQGGLRFLF